MLQNRVKIAILNYGDIHSPGCICFQKITGGEPPPHPWKGRFMVQKNNEGAPPADSECPLPGTKGFLRECVFSHSVQMCLFIS